MSALLLMSLSLLAFAGIGAFIEWMDRKDFPNGFPPGSMWG